MGELHGSLNDVDRSKHLLNIDPDDVSSNEHVPLWWHVGTRPVSANWLGQIYNQRTEAVRRSSGGKKGK